MKERPILFSAPMVRALLAGTKTQTRRVAKIVKSLPNGTGWDCLQRPGSRACIHLVGETWSWTPVGAGPTVPFPHIAEYCPYGRPGDRLWVKETHRPFVVTGRSRGIEYAAGGKTESSSAEWAAMLAKATGKWRPSIFMPRWASRLTLEITEVRCERLQSITEADAKAEGVTPANEDHTAAAVAYIFGAKEFQAHKSAYATLWEQLNGPGSCALNPWVWVISFRRVEA